MLPDADIFPKGPVKSKVPEIAAEPVNGKAVLGKFVKLDQSPANAPENDPVKREFITSPF